MSFSILTEWRGPESYSNVTIHVLIRLRFRIRVKKIWDDPWAYSTFICTSFINSHSSLNLFLIWQWDFSKYVIKMKVLGNALTRDWNWERIFCRPNYALMCWAWWSALASATASVRNKFSVFRIEIRVTKLFKSNLSNI